MRRILYYSLLCLLWVSVNSCKEDEAAQPPTPTFTVDRTSGLFQSTEFVFTIDQVGSDAVSLLPYGVEQPNTAGILVPASSFVNGKATVKFVYGQVGTFNAVVVANNHNGSGESVKNSVSAPTAITITSDRTAVTEFSLHGDRQQREKLVGVTSTKTEIDTTAKAITVTVPYGTDITKLRVQFAVSSFAALKFGTAAQTSEAFQVAGTEHDFTSPVTFTVEAENGETTDWEVSVVETPINTDNTVKSFRGLVGKKGGRGGRVLPASIDTVNSIIVLYDTLHTDGDKNPLASFDIDNYDSVALDWSLNSSFAYARDDDNNWWGVKDTVDFNDDQSFVVVPQDSTGTVDRPGTGINGIRDFDVLVAEAPRLRLSFGLNPIVLDSSDANFNLVMPVLQNTDLANIPTTFEFDTPAGMTIDAIMVDGAPVGATIDYSDGAGQPAAVDVHVTVTDAGVTFTVVYHVSLVVLKPEE